jgi:hypothetical protein
VVQVDATQIALGDELRAQVVQMMVGPDIENQSSGARDAMVGGAGYRCEAYRASARVRQMRAAPLASRHADWWFAAA